jgi:hypothetical protein
VAKIYATNPPVIDNPNTNLSAATAIGAGTLPVYNNAGFSNTTNLLLLGQYGDEQAEIVKSTATTPLSMSLLNPTIYTHNQDTFVYYMTYDQVEFSRSDDNAVSWSVLATINMQVDRQSTIYVDTGGTSTSLWRYRFVNSITGIFSSYSPSISSSGYDIYQLAKLWDRLIGLAQDPNLQVLSYQEMTDWFNECAEELSSAMVMSDNTSLSALQIGNFPANAVQLLLPADLNKVKYFILSYDGINFYKATAIDDVSDSVFDSLQSAAISQFSQSSPVYIRQDDAIVFYPSIASASIPPLSPIAYRLFYYRLPTYLVNPGDKLDLVFRPYTQLFIDYGMYRFKQKDKKFTEATHFYNIYERGKERFMEQAEKWQLDRPQSVDSRDFNYVMGEPRIVGHL